MMSSLDPSADFRPPRAGRSLRSTPAPPLGARREGFKGQRLTVAPPDVCRRYAESSLSGGLYPTAVGAFPHTQKHDVRRPNSVADEILILCAKGEGWCTIESKTWRIAAPAVLVIPRGRPHAYGASPAHPWSIYWAHYQGELVDAHRRAMQLSADNPVAAMTLEGALIDMFEQLYEAVTAGFGVGHLTRAGAALTHLLSLIVYRRHHPPPIAMTTNDRVQATLTLMQHHPQRNFNLEELAQAAGVSVSHYQAVFRQLVGQPPLETLRRLRVQQACVLLKTSTTPIHLIAKEIGYEDPYHFSRIFKKIMGVSPRTFRRNQATA